MAETDRNLYLVVFTTKFNPLNRYMYNAVPLLNAMLGSIGIYHLISESSYKGTILQRIEL